MRKVAVLGSTGSIGTQTLDVAREQGDIEIVALSCGGNTKLMEAQMREFRPKLVSVWSEEDAKALRENTKDLDIPVLAGMDGLLEVATHPDSEILVTAIVGMLGIRPTIAAIEAGKGTQKKSKTKSDSGGKRSLCDCAVCCRCVFAQYCNYSQQQLQQSNRVYGIR